MLKKRKTKISNECVPTFLKSDKANISVPDTPNGLFLNATYFSEEIITLILSYIDVKWILTCSLACRRWNNIIKSFPLWSLIYQRTYKDKPKRLPWYLYYCLFSTDYFDTNLLQNGNGQLGLKFWQCKTWDGDEYIEEVPVCANPLPEDVSEFNGCTSCFVTSYFSGFKCQLVEFKKSKLFRYILDNYKPHLYLSEWTTGRRDCCCVYKMHCGFIGQNGKKLAVAKPFVSYHKMQWDTGKWEKMEVLITDYPSAIEAVTFENEGCNTQTWKGHFGVKMAGGVIKFAFNSIRPLPVDDYGNFVFKQFEKVKFFANGVPQEDAIDYFQLDHIWNHHNDERYYFMP